MRDFKVYLPHHRDDLEPQILDATGKLMVLALLVGLIGLMVWTFMDAIVRTSELDQAIAEARRKERQRIYTANQDILAGHEAYMRQMDALIEREYRSKR